MRDFDTTRKVRKLAVNLGLERHPQIASRLQCKQMAKQELARIIAGVMYSEDPESQLDAFDIAKKANQKHKERAAEKRRRLRTGGVPRIPIWQNILEKFQLDHLKATARAGVLHSLPLSFFAQEGVAGGAEITPLRARLGMEEQGIVDLHDFVFSAASARPGIDVDEEEAVVPLHTSPPGADRVFFSIIDSTPFKARIIPLPPGTGRALGPDDVQIAIHRDCRSPLLVLKVRKQFNGFERFVAPQRYTDFILCSHKYIFIYIRI